MEDKIKEALQDYVVTANSGKYSTWEEINSKFPEFKDFDKEALKDYVATYNSGKYDTWEALNVKFPEFKDVTVGKEEEVSGEGSPATSEEFTEPSLTSRDVDVAETGQEFIVPEGAERIESGFIDPTEDLNPEIGEGTLYNLLEGVEVTAPKQEEVKQSFVESFQNSLHNTAIGLKKLKPQIQLASAKVWKDIFGNVVARALLSSTGSLGVVDGETAELMIEDLSRRFAEGVYGNTFLSAGAPRDYTELVRGSASELERLDQLTLETRGDITGGLTSGDIGATLSGISESLLDIIPSMVVGAVTFGGGTVASLMGDAVYEFNKEGAELEGTDFLDYISQGKGDSTTPLLIGGLMGAMERVGFKGVKDVFLNSLGNSQVKRRLSAIAYDWNKEGMTEYLQSSLEIVNQGVAQGLSEGEIASSVVDFMTSQEGLETYLRGVSATALVWGVGRGIRKGRQVVLDVKSKKALGDMSKQLTDLITDLKNSNDEATVNVILDKVMDISVASNGIQEYNTVKMAEASDGVKNRVEEINTRIDELFESIEQENISETTKATIEESISTLEGELETISKEVNNEVVQEVEQTTEKVIDEKAKENIFSIITNEQTRSDRITELEGRLKQNLQDDSNLGVAQDPKQKAKKDLEFLRDLTEYAVLKIADGTIKTAEAFTQAVQQIGDFGQEVINKAYYSAKEVAQEYVDTRPAIEQVDVAQGEVLSRMQDVTVDRTPSASKVTSKKVKDVTEGKIQGKVTMTNKQALANQIRTLNRGAKDMAKNVKEIGQSLERYVKRDKDRFKGLSFPSGEYARLARVLAGITDEKQMDRAFEIVNKALTDAEFRKKYQDVKKKQSAVKKKPFPSSLKPEVKEFSEIDPRNLKDLIQVEEYLNMLESLNKTGYKVSEVSIEAMNRMVDIAEANRAEVLADKEAQAEINKTDEEWLKKQQKYKEKTVEKLEKELKELGLSEGEIEMVKSDSTTIDEIIDTLRDKRSEIKPTRMDVIRDTSNKLLKEIKDNIVNIRERLTESDARKLDQFLKDLDLEMLEDKWYLPLNYVLNNILNNSSINGIGRFASIARSAKKFADKAFMDEALGNFRVDNKKRYNLLTFMLKRAGESYDQYRKRMLATLYTRTEALVKDTRGIGAIQRFFGFQQYDANSKQIQIKLSEVKKDIHKIIKKYNRLNPKYWQDSYNSTMAGAYTILSQYRKGWTAEEIEQNYVDRLQAIAESLDRLRNEGETMKTKTYDNAVVNLTKVVDKIMTISRDSEGNIESVTPKMTLNEMWNELPEGYREYYNYTRNFFEENKEEFFTVTRMFSKEDVETDWANYYPMSYIDYTRMEGTAGQTKSQVDFTEALKPFNFRSTTAPTSGAGISRTIKGKMLPKDKIFNFDLLGNFEVEAGRMLSDIGTLESKWDMNIMTDVRNNGIARSTDYEGIASVLSYRDILADRVLNDQELINRKVYGDPDGLRIAGEILRTVGTIRTLGGFAQFVKQTTPIAEVGARLKNPQSLALATQLFLSGKASHILKQADTQLRANQESLFSISQSTANLNSEVDKSLRSVAKAVGMKYQDLLEYAGKASLYPLIKTDQVIADIGWLALYIDNATMNGKKLDLKGEVSTDAVGYADLTNSVIMNASDPSMQGNYAKSGFRWIQPMMGFSMNTAHNFQISVSKLSDAVKSADIQGIRRYSAEVVGNLANAVLFVAISLGTRQVGVMAGQYIVEQVIKGSEDDEERKEELTKFLKEEFGNRRVLDKARTVNYAVNDLITRGILSDITTPMIGAVMEFAGVQESIFGKEELQKAKYTYAPFTSSSTDPFVNAVQSYLPVAGVMGMGVSSTIAGLSNITDVFDTHEEFIKARHAISTADGKDIIVDEGYLTEEGKSEYGMPNYLSGANYLSGIMGMISLAGFSDQTTNTMVRNIKIATKKLSDKDRGKGRVGDYEKVLKEEVVKFDSYNMLGQEISLTPDEMRRYSKQYLDEVEKIDNQMGDTRKDLTVTEREGIKLRSARKKTEAQIILDNIDKIESLTNKKKAKLEAKTKVRQATLERQKLK